MSTITNTRKLNKGERIQIAKMMRLGYGDSVIARELGRDRSSIWRERQRMKGIVNQGDDYITQGHVAHESAHARRVQASTKGRMHKADLKVQRYIEYAIKKGVSPDLISGRLKYLTNDEISISHETIYQWIYQERGDLYQYLIKAGKQRRRRVPNRNKRTFKQPAAPKTSIEQRPVIVLKRDRIGDIEHDSIVSRQSNVALQTVVDRSCRKVFIQKLDDQCADTYSKALIGRMKEEYPKGTLKTGTNDNGKENANHKIIDEALGINSYFSHPYCSSERGTVENRNGIIRRFVPKKTDIAEVSIEKLKSIEDYINNRPMKCLDFMTPNEKWCQLLTTDSQSLQQAA